jgi:hypothetical protein
MTIEQLRPLNGEGHSLTALARTQIGRAGDHGLRRPLAILDYGQDKALSMGVGLNLKDFTDKQFIALPGVSDVVDVGDFQSGHDQPVDEVVQGNGNLNKIFQPA